MVVTTNIDIVSKREIKIRPEIDAKTERKSDNIIKEYSSSLILKVVT
jgi:hypothetical protein